MRATALICDEQQQFSLQPVTLNDPDLTQVAIRTHFSGVSIGTEFALIRNKLSWGPYPLCTGYMCTGEIEFVGDLVESLQVGDLVYCRGNNTGEMRLDDGQVVSRVSGAHCSHIVAQPDTSHGVAKLPPGAPVDVCSTFVMPAVGLYGVDMANPRMGETVVVHGTGLIGLGVVAACAHRGCRVVAVDLDSRRLAVAQKLGADMVIDAGTENVAARVAEITGQGADVVFECTGLPKCIDLAIPLCRTLGKFVWQGNYGAAPISMHFLPPHGRRLQMFFPCDDGLQPCRRAVIKNMSMGTLPWEKTISHRVEAAEAPALYEQINRDNADVLGAVIGWM